jgi:hypothetical protein
MSRPKSCIGSAIVGALLLVSIPSCITSRSKDVSIGPTPPPAVFVSTQQKPAVVLPRVAPAQQMPSAAVIRQDQAKLQAAIQAQQRNTEARARQAEQEAQSQAQVDYLRGRASYNSNAMRGTLPEQYQPGYQERLENQRQMQEWRQQQGRTVYVTRTGTHYHARDCRHASGAATMTQGQAEQSGLTACAHCSGGLF